MAERNFEIEIYLMRKRRDLMRKRRDQRRMCSPSKASKGSRLGSEIAPVHSGWCGGRARIEASGSVEISKIHHCQTLFRPNSDWPTLRGGYFERSP